MTHYIQANTNGRLHPASEPSLSPLNRGFLYGDAVYEVWRTYAGSLFAWEPHWRRLERSAGSLHLRLPWSQQETLEEIRRTVDAYFAQVGGVRHDVYVRLQISRGAGPIGLDTQLADKPDAVLLVQENPRWSREKAEAGLQLSLARGLRRNPPESLNPAWKTGNYLNNILCLREARERGADEVVITNAMDEVTEAAVSNLAFFREDTLFTPPLSAGILGGITRELVLGGIACAAGLRVREEALYPDALGRFSECCLLSTTKDVTPVRSIDDVRYAVGPGSMVTRLKEAFASYTKDYAAAHPELRLFAGRD